MNGIQFAALIVFIFSLHAPAMDMADLPLSVLYEKAEIDIYNEEYLKSILENKKEVHLALSDENVTLPVIENPLLNKEPVNVVVHAIDEAHANLETNGFEVLDFSNDREFVSLLEQFSRHDLAGDKAFIEDLKRNYIVRLKILLDQWLLRSNRYNGATWQPITERSAVIRTTTPPTSRNDTRQPVLSLLHLDYRDKQEFRRFTKLVDNTESINPEIGPINSESFVTYINIWAPTDPMCGGTPLGVVDRTTMDMNNDLLDAIVVPVFPDIGLMPSHQFIGRTIKFNKDKHKIYSVKEWIRGKVIVFLTFETPHAALNVNPEIERNSVEVRGFFEGCKK